MVGDRHRRAYRYSMLLVVIGRWSPDLHVEEAQPLLDTIERADARTPVGLLVQMELLCWALDTDTDPEPELLQRLSSCASHCAGWSGGTDDDRGHPAAPARRPIHH